MLNIALTCTSCKVSPGADKAVANAQPRASVDYTAKPPFTADEFWRKALALLNEQNGSITRQRFETLFGAHFASVTTEIDGTATTYRIQAGTDWYFTASLVNYNDRFHSPVQPVENGAHSSWAIGWPADAFGDPSKGQCVTAARVRADLLATGWTSPWPRWGIAEEPRPTPDPGVPQLGTTVNPVLEYEPPPAEFFRQSEVTSDPLRRLPRGRVFSTGDLPGSCVTVLGVTAKP